jgi:hypothetical protein
MGCGGGYERSTVLGQYLIAGDVFALPAILVLLTLIFYYCVRLLQENNMKKKEKVQSFLLRVPYACTRK